MLRCLERSRDRGAPGLARGEGEKAGRDAPDFLSTAEVNNC